MTVLTVTIDQVTAETLEGRCSDWRVFPQPGTFIGFVTEDNHTFYTQIQSVSPVPASENELRLVMIPVLGSPDIRIKEANQVSQKEFHRLQTGQSQAEVPMPFQDVVFDLGKSGHVVYLKPNETNLHREVLQGFVNAGCPMVITDPIGVDLEGLNARELVIGRDVQLSIQGIGTNLFVAWVAERLPKPVQQKASEFLLSLIPPTPDFIPIQYFVNHPLLKNHPLSAAILHELYEFHKHRLFASLPQKALSLDNLTESVHLNFSGLPPDLLPRVYESLLKMILRHVYSHQTQFVLVAPEIQSQCTTEFIQQIPNRVFLVSNIASPWQDLIVDRWQEARVLGEKGLKVQGKVTDGLSLFIPYVDAGCEPMGGIAQPTQALAAPMPVEVPLPSVEPENVAISITPEDLDAGALLVEESGSSEPVAASETMEPTIAQEVSQAEMPSLTWEPVEEPVEADVLPQIQIEEPVLDFNLETIETPSTEESFELNVQEIKEDEPELSFSLDGISLEEDAMNLERSLEEQISEGEPVEADEVLTLDMPELALEEDIALHAGHLELPAEGASEEPLPLGISFEEEISGLEVELPAAEALTEDISLFPAPIGNAAEWEEDVERAPLFDDSPLPHLEAFADDEPTTEEAALSADSSFPSPVGNTAEWEEDVERAPLFDDSPLPHLEAFADDEPTGEESSLSIDTPLDEDSALVPPAPGLEMPAPLLDAEDDANLDALAALQAMGADVDENLPSDEVSPPLDLPAEESVSMTEDDNLDALSAIYGETLPVDEPELGNTPLAEPLEAFSPGDERDNLDALAALQAMSAPVAEDEDPFDDEELEDIDFAEMEGAATQGHVKVQIVREGKTIGTLGEEPGTDTGAEAPDNAASAVDDLAFEAIRGLLSEDGEVREDALADVQDETLISEEPVETLVESVDMEGLSGEDVNADALAALGMFNAPEETVDEDVPVIGVEPDLLQDEGVELPTEETSMPQEEPETSSESSLASLMSLMPEGEEINLDLFANQSAGPDDWRSIDDTFSLLENLSSIQGDYEGVGLNALEIEAGGDDFYNMLQVQIPDITKGLPAIPILGADGTLDIEWEETVSLKDDDNALMSIMAPDLISTVTEKEITTGREDLTLEAESVEMKTVYKRIGPDGTEEDVQEEGAAADEFYYDYERVTDHEIQTEEREELISQIAEMSYGVTGQDGEEQEVGETVVEELIIEMPGVSAPDEEIPFVTLDQGPLVDVSEPPGEVVMPGMALDEDVAGTSADDDGDDLLSLISAAPGYPENQSGSGEDVSFDLAGPSVLDDPTEMSSTEMSSDDWEAPAIDFPAEEFPQMEEFTAPVSAESELSDMVMSGIPDIALSPENVLPETEEEAIEFNFDLQSVPEAVPPVDEPVTLAEEAPLRVEPDEEVSLVEDISFDLDLEQDDLIASLQENSYGPSQAADENTVEAPDLAFDWEDAMSEMAEAGEDVSVPLSQAEVPLGESNAILEPELSFDLDIPDMETEMGIADVPQPVLAQEEPTLDIREETAVELPDTLEIPDLALLQEQAMVMEEEPMGEFAAELLEQIDFPIMEMEMPPEPEVIPQPAPAANREPAAPAGSSLPVLSKQPKEGVVSPYRPGEQVFHKRYGQGIIKRVITMDEKQVILNINFESVGKRLLDPSLTQLEKVS